MKIGRYEYDIVPGDKFLDNGACVQLITQSKERMVWGKRKNPTLSKKAILELKKMTNLREYTHHGSTIYEVINND